MMTAGQRNMLLIADRTKDANVIGAVIEDLIEREVSLIDIELVLRAATGNAYLVAADKKISIVIGMPAWVVTLAKAGITPETNRAALAQV
jgi:hypothetical protein